MSRTSNAEFDIRGFNQGRGAVNANGAGRSARAVQLKTHGINSDSVAEDTMPASLATIVVLVIIGLDPHNAAQQPIMRLFDTAIGVVIGLAAVWAAGRVTPLPARERQVEATMVRNDRS